MGVSQQHTHTCARARTHTHTHLTIRWRENLAGVLESSSSAQSSCRYGAHQSVHIGQ